jgi:hypothetical protein
MICLDVSKSIRRSHSAGAMAQMSENKALAQDHLTGPRRAATHSNAFGEPPLYELGAELTRMLIPGGQILFRENEAADSLYFVISGCLGVILRDSTGPDVLIARIEAGETVGEMGFLDGGVRSATVEALRDTELLRLDKTAAPKTSAHFCRLAPSRDS